MEFQQLRCFKEVVAVHGCSQAAANLGIGRTGVRLNIKGLERDLSATLFEGDEKQDRYILTEQGKVLMSYADRILSVAEKAVQRMHDMSEGGAPCVRIAYNDNLKHIILPKVCGSYLDSGCADDVRFNFMLQHHVEDIVRALSTREADVAFSQARDPRVHALPIARDQLFVLLPADHPLAKKRSIRLAELDDMPLILPSLSYISQPHGSKMSSLDSAIDSMFEAEHISPRILPISGNMESRVCYVQAGLGYTITSSFPQNDENIASIEIDNPYSTRTIYLLWPKNRGLSIEAEDFKDYCIDFFKNKHDQTFR